MKSLILVAVILQLVIIATETDGKYQFGDIIEFPRACIDGMPTFSHYAVYVGPESGVNVGQGDNDIFHRTDTVESEYKCEFGKFNKWKRNSTDGKKNYLDDDDKAAENRTTDKIKKRIEEMKRDCGKYGLITNNCEHLATYVRYGRRSSRQEGTRFGCIFPLAKNAKAEQLKKYDDAMKELDILQKQNNSTGNDEGPCVNNAHKPDRLSGKLSACQIVLAFVCCFLIGLSVRWGVKRFCITRIPYSREGV